MRIKLIIFGLCVATTSIAQINTDRPSASASSITVSKGVLQLESGVSMERFSTRGFWIENYHVPDFLFKYGIADKLELRYSSNYGILNSSFIDGQQGFGLSNLGFKYQFMNGENANFSLISEVVLPIKINNTAVQSSIAFTGCYSYSFSPRSSIGTNLSLRFGSGIVQMDNTLYYNFAISPKINTFLEVYGNTASINNLESSYHYDFYFDSGMTYAIKDNQQLDFSFGTGINLPYTYYSLGYSVILRRAQ